MGTMAMVFWIVVATGAQGHGACMPLEEAKIWAWHVRMIRLLA